MSFAPLGAFFLYHTHYSFLFKAKIRNIYICWFKKNYRWIWISVDRYGKRFISFVSGDRSTKTGLALWDNIKGMIVNYFASDYWKSYEELIPADKHLQTKAETYTVEEYNSRIRDYLARFKRKENVTAKRIT